VWSASCQKRARFAVAIAWSERRRPGCRRGLATCASAVFGSSDRTAARVPDNPSHALVVHRSDCAASKEPCQIQGTQHPTRPNLSVRAPRSARSLSSSSRRPACYRFGDRAATSQRRGRVTRFVRERQRARAARCQSWWLLRSTSGSDERPGWRWPLFDRWGSDLAPPGECCIHAAAGAVNRPSARLRLGAEARGAADVPRPGVPECGYG
jgi:hypothetical protein